LYAGVVVFVALSLGVCRRAATRALRILQRSLELLHVAGVAGDPRDVQEVLQLRGLGR
jgi:hypothetical protein